MDTARRDQSGAGRCLYRRLFDNSSLVGLPNIDFSGKALAFTKA